MASNKRLPPGPRAPAAWQLFAYGRDAVSFIEKCRARYGPIFRLRFPLQPRLIVVSDADAIEQLLNRAADEIPPAPANHGIKSIFGPDSLLFKTGDDHRQDRSFLTPHFSREAALAEREAIRQQVNRHLKPIGLQSFDVYPWAYRLTLRLTLMMFWGCQDLDLIERIEHVVELSRQRYESYRHMIFDTVAMSPQQYPVASRFARLISGNHRDRLRQQFADLINEHAHNIRRSPESYAACPFITRLAQLPHDSPVDGSFVDFVMTVLIAGYDPPAATTTWLLLELAKRPSLQQQICAEQTDAASSGDSLVAMIHEVYRLYPPLHSMTRTLTSPTEIGGYDLPSGTFVLPSIYLLHRDPRHWEAPVEFRPDRFSNRQIAYNLQDGYLPFGAGTRTCPGRHFATVISHTIAVEVLSQYRLTALQDQLLPPRTLGPTLVPDDRMAIRLEPIPVRIDQTLASPE